MAGRPSLTRDAILSILSMEEPKSHRRILRETGLSPSAVWNCLRRCWQGGFVLRTRKAVYESEKVFRGRAGTSVTTRPYHLYLLRGNNVDSVRIDGLEYVSYSEKHLDPRGGRGKSKAGMIRDFLRENRGKAWFSKEIANTLKEKGVKIGDIMSTVRRMERKRLVYVRGYRYHDRETPFSEGYLITWIDEEKSREEALEEAIERTNSALESRSSTNPLIQRVHQIKDMVFEASKLRDIIDFGFIQNKLGCADHEAERALRRALQLYPEIQVIKLFGLFRYFYHVSMPDNELNAIVGMKKNFIRIAKGRDNRVGHNWEAVPGWFIDHFTTGARFWTQNHRNKDMDPRRITIHLLKGVGGRRSNAEVDRVWEVTPGIFAQPIVYVLECKWGLVNKRDLDDFFEVLKWSKEFGVDTPEGRSIKQGINGIFAASSFNPRENIHLKDGEEISLSAYSKRMNIQLLRASDFNSKLHEKGIPKSVTVQKVCRYARNENEVRELLNLIWAAPTKSEIALTTIAHKNNDLFEFEKMLKIN